MQEKGLTGRDLKSAILFGAFLYLGIRFIGQIVDVILIFGIIGLLVVSLNPIVSYLEKRRVPRGVSSGVLALCVLGGLGLVVYAVVPPVERQVVEIAKEFPRYLDSIKPWMSRLERQHPSLAAYLPKDAQALSAPLRQFGASILGGASKIGASAAAIVGGAFLIFVCTIYSLAHPRPLVEGLLKACGPAYRSRAEAAGRRLAAQVQAWARGILIAMVSIFGLTWIALSVIGLKQAFLFAVIAGFLEAVPIIGPVVSAIPPIIVSLVAGHYVAALWVVVAFVVIQQIENHLLVPLVMSRQLSLHPVTVIFAVLVMGGLFGIVGVFLASPVAAAAGILLDELYFRGLDQEKTDLRQAGS